MARARAVTGVDGRNLCAGIDLADGEARRGQHGSYDTIKGEGIKLHRARLVHIVGHYGFNLLYRYLDGKGIPLSAVILYGKKKHIYVVECLGIRYTEINNRIWERKIIN